MIVALLGLKGGTGKTTIASGLAGTVAQAGRRVAAVDLDPLGCLSDWSARAAPHVPNLVGIRGGFLEAEWIRALARGFDLVVVDCGAGDRKAHETALACADLALLPVTPSPMETAALAGTFELLGADCSTAPVALVANRVDRRTDLGRRVKRRLQRTGVRVMETEISARIVHAEAWLAGACVATYCDRSAEEFSSLWRELGPQHCPVHAYH